jgi:hypothetical protein
MHFQCTKKVLDFIKTDIINKDSNDDIFAWHVNYIVILRKKFFVFMHDLSRFSVVLYGLKKSDFKNIEDIFKIALYETMLDNEIDKTLINKYINGINSITYSKSKDRQKVAQLNRAMQDADAYAHDGIYDQLNQLHISYFLNNGFVGSNQWKEVHIPKKKFIEYLDLL